MTITIHGQRFDLLYVENIALIPQLAQRLAQEAAQASERATPTRDRSPQSADRAALTVTVRLAEVA